MYRVIQNWRPEGVSLPDKISDLLELALNAAGRLDRSRYQMDASVFHQSALRRDDDKWGVCLAGAVMARPLKAPIKANCNPQSMVDDER